MGSHSGAWFVGSCALPSFALQTKFLHLTLNDAISTMLVFVSHIQSSILDFG